MSAESNARSHVSEFSWWVGNSEMDETKARLRDLAAVRDAANELIADEAGFAHDAMGLSWSVIGEALGMSKQAAHQRYRR